MTLAFMRALAEIAQLAYYEYVIHSYPRRYG
jgi:hypothetical protein